MFAGVGFRSRAYLQPKFPLLNIGLFGSFVF